jgi:hypothetical protein
MLDQHQQQVEGFGREWDALARAQQKALEGVKAERSELV